MIKTFDKKKITHNYADFAYFYYILFKTDTKDLLKHVFSSFYRHNISFRLHVVVGFFYKRKSQLQITNTNHKWFA